MALAKDVKSSSKVVIALILGGLISACSSVSTPSGSSGNSQAGRYAITQDRAPTVAMDPSLIRDVIPTPINRTMAGNRSPYTVNGRSYRVMASEEGFQETGLASWYGEKFHGHATSNGEIFDMYQVSAAHTRLPIPSFARVTNLENQRSIIVRVNDRGPFHNERIIDLSFAAAYKLGFADQGTALVHVESIVPGQERILAAASRPAAPVMEVNSAPARYLQAGAFADLSSAQRLSDRLRNMTGRPVFIRSIQADGPNQQLHRVRIGPIVDSHELQRVTDLIVGAGLGQPFTVQE